MINTVESDATLIERTDIANCSSFESTSRRLEITRARIARKLIFLRIVIFSIAAFVAATAQAQGPLGRDLTPVSATPTGWWSPDTDCAADPHLLVAMVEGGQVRNAEVPRTQSRFYTSTPGPDYSTTVLGNFASASKAPRGLSSLAYGEVPPSDSLFSSMETKYTLWESSLADSQPTIRMNGVFVYSLLQVSYEDSHLPISLYVPALRGSEPR